MTGVAGDRASRRPAPQLFAAGRMTLDALDEACFVEGRCPVCGAEPDAYFDGDPVVLHVLVWHHDGCPAFVDRPAA